MPRHWSRKLPRAVADRDGTIIRTCDEARQYILALPAPRQARNQWQHAARLLLDGAPAADVAQQLELALLLDGQLRMT